MNDQLDARIRELMGAVDSATPNPHNWSTVERRSVTQTRQRRLLVPALAAAATAALLAGGIVVLAGRDQDSIVSTPSESVPLQQPLAADQLLAVAPTDAVDSPLIFTDLAALEGNVADVPFVAVRYIGGPIGPDDGPSMRDVLPAGDIGFAVTYGPQLAPGDGVEGATVLTTNVPDGELVGRLSGLGYVDQGDGWMTIDVPRAPLDPTAVHVSGGVVAFGQHRPFVEAALARLAAARVDPALAEAFAQTTAPIRVVGAFRVFAGVDVDAAVRRCSTDTVSGRFVDGRTEWVARSETGWVRETAATDENSAEVLNRLADEVCDR